jgi:hypothetical protein
MGIRQTVRIPFFAAVPGPYTAFTSVGVRSVPKTTGTRNLGECIRSEQSTC